MICNKTIKVDNDSGVVDVEMEFSCTEESIKDGRNPLSMTFRVIANGVETSLVGWPAESMKELGRFIFNSAKELERIINQ